MGGDPLIAVLGGLALAYLVTVLLPMPAQGAAPNAPTGTSAAVALAQQGLTSVSAVIASQPQLTSSSPYGGQW